MVRVSDEKVCLAHGRVRRHGVPIAYVGGEGIDEKIRMKVSYTYEQSEVGVVNLIMSLSRPCPIPRCGSAMYES
jgi:hypothetical protein